jgi:hypothetical protein
VRCSPQALDRWRRGDLNNMKNLSIHFAMALLAASSVQISGVSAGKLADDPYPSCDRAGCVVSSAAKLADDPYPSCDRAGCVVG